jgi:hypothetical protein
MPCSLRGGAGGCVAAGGGEHVLFLLGKVVGPGGRIGV